MSTNNIPADRLPQTGRYRLGGPMAWWVWFLATQGTTRPTSTLT